MNNAIVSELIVLNNSYQNWLNNNSEKKFLNSVNLLNKFASVYYSELNKLPDRLNLLDDLSTNENAHSKFLIRLLQYQPALLNFLSFINSVNKHNFFFDTNNVRKPILTFEKMRIDGLIKEGNKYAIIIENKIHNAVEQKHQIGRYIDKCKVIGFREEQIFIIYLTKTKQDKHSDQTWGTNYSLLNFNNRYCKLSYKSEILPWLENYLKILSPSKEELIKSAVVQYIDHLKHFFNKKEIYSNMNAELQKFLSSELNLSTDNAENIEVIDNKLKEINKLKEQLEIFSRTSKKQLFINWKIKLDENFDLNEVEKFSQSKESLIKTGVILNYNGKKFSVLIEHNFHGTYFGFGRQFASETLEPEIKEFLQSINYSENLEYSEPWWYGWQETSFIEGFLKLENLIKITKEKISSSKET